MILVEVVVVGLVAYRLWRLLAVDDLTEPVRLWLHDHAPRVLKPWTCQWCAGFHCTLVVGLVAYFAGLTDGTPWLVIPAASVVVGFLGEKS